MDEGEGRGSANDSIEAGALFSDGDGELLINSGSELEIG